MTERAYGDADPGAREPNARSASDETAGRKAERLVHDRLRAAFPDSVAILENVRWRERVHGHFRDGEADLVVADPDRGILIVEVKSGEIRRAGGTWWAGNKELPQSPFEQAASSRHALVRKLRELPAWDPTLNPVAGDAVAFPDVDVASAGARLGMLGPDVDPELILDQHRLRYIRGPSASRRVRGRTTLPSGDHPHTPQQVYGSVSSCSILPSRSAARWRRRASNESSLK